MTYFQNPIYCKRVTTGIVTDLIYHLQKGALFLTFIAAPLVQIQVIGPNYFS